MRGHRNSWRIAGTLNPLGRPGSRGFSPVHIHKPRRDQAELVPKTSRAAQNDAEYGSAGPHTDEAQSHAQIF
jgi:hypothetical protein